MKKFLPLTQKLRRAYTWTSLRELIRDNGSSRANINSFMTKYRKFLSFCTALDRSNISFSSLQI